MRVALTGGIASGKSTVAAMFTELGAVVIDSDQLAREVVAKGTPGLAAIVERFGPDILTPEGELDRPKMAEIVFADPDRRKELEAITHPLVGEASAALEAAAREQGRMVINDIPLLVEAGLAGLFDVVIVVDTDRATQLSRMVEDRGWTPEESQARIDAQASREDRLAIADVVIDNTGTLDALAEQVRRVYEELDASGGVGA